MNRWLGLLALASLVSGTGAAQDTTAGLRLAPAVGLSLEEAIRQARQNSPTYHQTLNNAGPARWGVRNAYGSLLPSVNVAADLGYTGSGQSNFGGGFIRPTPAFRTSGYSLGLQWQLDGRILSGPGQQKALQRAADEDISGAGVALRAEITNQYLSTLQAEAQVEVARQQVSRNADFLELARARHQVGQATLLDVRQAEVIKAQSDVALLRGIQADREAKLDLLRRMGVESPVPIDQMTLSDSFPVMPPAFDLDSLLAVAETQNPTLRGLQARRTASWWGVRAAKSEFLPTLSVQAGWSGFTQEFTDQNLLLGGALTEAQARLADCTFNNAVRAGLNLGGEVPNCATSVGVTSAGDALLDPVAQQIRDDNNVFPFDYTGQPFRASLTISLPIFTGFGRSLRLAEARAQQDDLEQSVRAARLQVRTDVRGRLLALETAYRSIEVQEASRAAARDQSRLAQERYRVGAGASLEVSDAQNAVQRAEGDYVNAVYDYHKAIAALEAAVGRSLR